MCQESGTGTDRYWLNYAWLHAGAAAALPDPEVLPSQELVAPQAKAGYDHLVIKPRGSLQPLPETP